MSDKPIKTKPHFYAACLLGMQEVAKKMGYNLICHGSMNRDLDLVAIAWIDNPESHHDLIYALCDYLGVMRTYNPDKTPWDYNHSVLPGGRDSYVINLNRGGKYNDYFDNEYYLDISFTPQIKSL